MSEKDGLAPTGPPPVLERIVVLLDASRSSLGALEAAMELAARRQAELVALFVEEEALLRSAAYPWAREVGLSGAIRPMERSGLEERLRARAEAIRAALTRAAGGRAVRWTFRVSRGGVVRETLLETRPGDLLILGKVGYARARGLRLGSTAKAMLGQAPGPVMIYDEAAPSAASVLVVVESADQGARALLTAAALAGDGDAQLTVLLPPLGSPETTEQRDRAVESTLARVPGGVNHRLRPLTRGSPAAIAAALRGEPGRQLVIGRDSALLKGAAAQKHLEAVDLPVVVVP